MPIVMQVDDGKEIYGHLSGVRLPSRRLCERLAERRMPQGSWAANHSLEVTWDAAEFAFAVANLISWRARVGECPGASARGRWAAVSLF